MAHEEPANRPATVDVVEERGLLTPETKAIVGFVLAVLSLQGQGGWTIGVQHLFGTHFAPEEYANVLAAGGLATLAVAGAGAYLGRRAVGDLGGVTWAAHLGRAAVVLGSLGVALAALTVLAGLLQRV